MILFPRVKKEKTGHIGGTQAQMQAHVQMQGQLDCVGETNTKDGIKLSMGNEILKRALS